MKKLFFAAILLPAAIALQSCLGESEGNHGTTIYTRNGAPYIEMYADQTIDSFYVVSYDSWTAVAKSETPDWISFSDLKCNVPVDYVVTQSVLVKTTPNTTGLSRVAHFVLTSDYKEFGNLETYVYQSPWLNISVPLPVYDKKEDGTAELVYKHTIDAADNYATMAFTVYSDATLTSDADWFIVQNDDRNLKPGNYGIKFVVTPNGSAEERTAHVTLTSNGVSTVVSYTQKGKK